MGGPNRRGETRVVGGLYLEANVEIQIEDNVMQHLVTGLVRPAEDLPGYEVVGQSQVWASSIGKAGGEVCCSVIQGEIYVKSDPDSPIPWPRPLSKPVYATGPRTVAETSKNKVFCGRPIEVNGNGVLVIIETTGQSP